MRRLSLATDAAAPAAWRSSPPCNAPRRASADLVAERCDASFHAQAARVRFSANPDISNVSATKFSSILKHQPFASLPQLIRVANSFPNGGMRTGWQFESSFEGVRVRSRPPLRSQCNAVARHQTLDKFRVQFRDCRIPDQQHVLCISHRMVRKIEAPRHDNLVRDNKLIVHEVVWLRLILTIKGD
jgi:hypothetical protein